MLCPCCSKLSYESCCKPFIEFGKKPPSAEALMRSRYTAYTQANIEYIVKSMRGLPRKGFNKSEAKSWAQSVEWQKLEVLTATSDTVEFKAYFKTNGHTEFIHENSKFKETEKSWFYIGSIDDFPVKVSQNSPCPCKSGKKYKRCCGRP